MVAKWIETCAHVMGQAIFSFLPFGTQLYHNQQSRFSMECLQEHVRVGLCLGYGKMSGSSKLGEFPLDFFHLNGMCVCVVSHGRRNYDHVQRKEKV